MSPGVENLFALLRALGKTDTHAALMKEYQAGNRKYAPLKDAVADALVELTGGLRARRAAIAADPAAVWKQVAEMSARARDKAAVTLAEVRERVGLPRR